MRPEWIRSRIIELNDANLDRLPEYDYSENGINYEVYGIPENQPTVDAVPIEWIKKWLNNIANNERYKNEYVELTEEVKRIVYRQDMIIKIPCISDMLEDWEKENEID